MPRDWWERLGPTRGAAIYGLVLGLGITTLVPFAAFYFLLAAAAVVGPTMGLWVGLGYGLGRAAPVLFASVAIVRGADPTVVGDWPHPLRLAARTTAGILVLSLGLALAAKLA